MTQMKIADDEIKGQDWGIPFIYTMGFVLLVVFYIIEWYFLGCYGPPNPSDRKQLLSELANHPGLQDSIYFSIITSTTLGYGDLAPLTGGAKMLASTQALTCSIYMATGLAILLTKRRDPVKQ
ncbi:potassium channel family protein [Paraburkholderia ferrariae]|uniref:potassium channel family protein n=1 Tax=Paraburkholderia ferrariae TaxID=386056 RepID=UPI0014700FFC|nr:potassium channel family protein [Paraburkholderia ferrariae]